MPSARISETAQPSTHLKSLIYTFVVGARANSKLILCENQLYRKRVDLNKCIRYECYVKECKTSVALYPDGRLENVAKFPNHIHCDQKQTALSMSFRQDLFSEAENRTGTANEIYSRRLAW